MNLLAGNFLAEIKTVIKIFSAYFKLSPISSAFFFTLFVVLVLNAVKGILIWCEKKKGDPSQSCKFLIKKDDEHRGCSIPRRQIAFKKNGYSCKGCKGKTFNMTNSEAEERAAIGAAWKRIIIMLANCSKSLLPYISFLYTLVLAIFEIQNA